MGGMARGRVVLWHHGRWACGLQHMAVWVYFLGGTMVGIWPTVQRLCSATLGRHITRLGIWLYRGHIPWHQPALGPAMYSPMVYVRWHMTRGIWHMAYSLWPRGRVAVWPRGPVAVWPCGRVAVWPCGGWAVGPLSCGVLPWYLSMLQRCRRLRAGSA